MICKHLFQVTNMFLQCTDDLILLSRHQFQVFGSVICSLIVQMVNMFIGSQWTVKFLSHNQTMFIHFAMSICPRMMPAKVNLDITIRADSAAQWLFSMFLLPCKMMETILTNAHERRFSQLFDDIIILYPAPGMTLTTCNRNISARSFSWLGFA